MGKKDKSKKNLPNVAYFCMEYGLDTSFRTYAGGLGILAGDYLKGAKDHDYPVIGIGIKWKQGYTDQLISKEGYPYDTYHNYKYDFLEDTGIEVSVEIKGQEVKCKVWKVDCFGNADIYLLDTDLPENPEAWTTGQLYGWFGEERVAQEIVLGIGGVKALRALGLNIDIYHFNEGHALFAGFELIREKMEDGMSFKEAKKATRKEVVFTTHTPVIQGNESHPIERLMYMGANCGLSEKQLIKLGGEPFNMTVGALKLSKVANAVAQLHGKTASKMWKDVEKRAEILAITNAIHKPTWVDERLISAAENGEDFWPIHQENKKALIDFVKERNGVTLKEDCLLIGFSRRAVAYKRSDFIFTDEEIAGPLFETGKLQIVFSGRAHPLDDGGKDIVARLVQMSKKYPESVVFLENYDMTIGKMLTRGADIWLNNPRRPKEASGTSGMKAAMNGVLNFSTLDGWWPEACNHGENGWQFGDGFESKKEEKLDEHDLKAFYKVLQEEVLPTYYDNQERWKEMMKNSIMDTKDAFAVKRMLEEYYELLYCV
ncbi:alpha-glucan family phosphorylase [Chondrinema litorale]|uniref:alpha-glucan family phosphorylase n=1 Tax=Chondrinema litorale TaxID=2994555 RepID=UPI0025429D79|nr:alpha-glucan family phosphorylase [Chondrinema litorale]UZR93867.1 alpha-glucan family phosphorylase [Chondrinema litorale]